MSRSQIPDRAPDPLQLTEFRPRTSLQSRIFRQTVLVATFCIVSLGGLAFFVSMRFLQELQIDPALVFVDPRSIGFTLLLFMALLVVFGFLLSVLLARQITRGISELSGKAHALRANQWDFPQTIRTGDEIESLDHIVAQLVERLRSAYLTLEHRMHVTAEGLRRETVIDSTVLESIDYGVLVVDAGGVITEANAAALRLLTAKREQIVGGSSIIALEFLTKHVDLTEGNHPVRKALRGEHYHSHPADHLRLLRLDQSFLPVNVIAAPLTQGKENFGAVVVFQDMTEERQIDYLKSEFISLASHQLRTPLSSIRWYAELLSGAETPALSADQKSYVAEIFASSVRMANLIEALLHVAKIESGVLVPEKRPIVLTDYLRQLIDEWVPLGKEKSIVFTVRLPGTSLEAVTDPVLLQIILQNLLSNAIKYSPKNTEIILSLDRKGDSAVISVEDAGIGILAIDQERLFQKFFRGHNARQIDTDGNGLGLYISRSIAGTLGGTVDFTSNTDKGSTFRIMLPLGEGKKAA